MPTPIHSATIAVIDCEATGLDLENDHPVEVAAVVIKTDGTRSEHQSLINPGVPIPPMSSAIHHLVDEDVAQAPPLERLLPKLRKLADVFAAHNAAYDRPMLRMNTAEDRQPWICTHRIACHLWPEAESHSNQYLRYWLKLDVPRAKGLPAHRALADAVVTAALLRRELETLEERGVLPETFEALVDWAAAPAELTRVTFGQHRGRLWSEMDRGFLDWVLKRDFAPDVLHTARLWIDRHHGA